MPIGGEFGFIGLAAVVVGAIGVLIYEYLNSGNGYDSGHGSGYRSGGNNKWNDNNKYGRQESYSSNQRPKGKNQCPGCMQRLNGTDLHPPFHICNHIFHSDCLPLGYAEENYCPLCLEKRSL